MKEGKKEEKDKEKEDREEQFSTITHAAFNGELETVGKK